MRFNRLSFHLDVDSCVPPSRFTAGVAEDVSDGIGIRTSLQHMHRQGMSPMSLKT